MEEQPDYSIFPEKRLVYASFGARLGAAIIDGLIIGVPLAIFNSICFDQKFSVQAFRYTFTTKDEILQSVIQIVVTWLYAALMTSGPLMATVGKRAVGIQVTDMNGNRIGFMQATGRHFGKIVSAIILLIGYFMMLWDDKKQTLHDKMAGTLVIAW